MGRPSLVCAASEGGDAKLLETLLAEYVELLARERSNPTRQVARVKQWLSLGTKANPAIAPLFERVKRLDDTNAVLASLGASS
jgi:hypothetical protein